MTFVSMNFQQKSQDSFVKILQEKLHQSGGENWGDMHHLKWNLKRRQTFPNYVLDIWILYNLYKRNCTNLKVWIEKMGYVSFEMESYEAGDASHYIFTEVSPRQNDLICSWTKSWLGLGLARCPTSCLTRQKYIQRICRWCCSTSWLTRHRI